MSIFTHREPGSPVAILNSTGKLAKPPQELVEVLTQAIKISQITNGAFDVTVKPLVDLYQQSQPKLPGADAVEVSAQSGGLYPNVRLQRGNFILHSPVWPSPSMGLPKATSWMPVLLYSRNWASRMCMSRPAAT